mmetsp:Transcript_27322/g.69543  ORF Transcript_27322/g.69543 Transcript_27322/m.69543 type:complete len:278 (-) Transcript_27322:196-1029(-)|eukprot:CAMPEP_0115855984 /NCGR_PEP_ID=MMETSP0287-20121206/14820_1 /TAXON_ID=412157 /ORGANISM="Chrysochromulina rotalis, Strain UIO044" /LENGTH=277 /DNA_ID=CAMNT_0003310147 /DNA_START=104 /DNA_END=940 /DNA_ORIENTATION=-
MSVESGIPLLIQTTARVRQVLRRNASLVVVGAHHFGLDENDPVYQAAKGVPWSDVLLVEASPVIAVQLQAQVESRNPTPLVPHHRVRVVNQGVCPGEKDATLPFYTFRDTAGLPFWATQIGSFSRSHVERHLKGLVSSQSSGYNYSVGELDKRIVIRSVLCTSLLSLLRRQRIRRLAVLHIDAEGLDCDLVSSQVWSSGEWCDEDLRPTMLVFEYKHCTGKSYANAIEALSHPPHGCHSSARTGAERMQPFRMVSESWENAFFTRQLPRTLRKSGGG